ncbi:MAG: transposase [Ruminococcus sp.]
MDYPKRKHPRLKEYDYSRNGYYFVTINTHRNMPLLSSVGRGLAPAEMLSLSAIGKIAEEQLFALEKRFSYVKIDKYAIMPTHIHVILILFEETEKTAGASPRPTLTDIVCAYKSLTTRICNQRDNTPGRKIFQTSFYEKIIRNDKSYSEVWQYIEDNPVCWEYEKQL